MSTIPPYWLVVKAKQLRDKGLDLEPAGMTLIQHVRRAIREGDWETYAWQAGNPDWTDLRFLIDWWAHPKGQ